MPWFKIDDSAYSHPKFVRAGNAALGLWLRCGAYSAQHLLEGGIPGIIAKDFGTPAQIKKLIAARLWHEADHNCPRCPQPEAGDYVMHDFLEGGRNSTRAQVEARRSDAADRQAKARATAAAKARGTSSAQKRDSNGAQFDERFNANASQSDPHFSQRDAGQEYESQRDGVGSVTPSQAKPSYKPASRQESKPEAVALPEWTQPLIDALNRKGVSVSWAYLGPGQLVAIQELINTRGVQALADIAASRWNPRDPIKYVSLLLKIWLEHPAPSLGSQASRPSSQPKPPWCEDPDCDPVTRTRDIENDRGLRFSQPCAKCHPNRKAPAA